jgi:hypothetical protein
MSCVVCGVSIIDAESDADGYFVLNQITAEEDIDYNICGAECLKTFVNESVLD